MHLLRGNGEAMKGKQFQRAVVTYSAFHIFRQGVQTMTAHGNQILALFCLGCIDAVLLLVAAFSWMMFWPVAVIFTIPFVSLTAAIIYQLSGLNHFQADDNKTK